ncbi:hypothetical protein GJ496_001681 [Pomphorhynchus laevis]|nr:hypothetical protein GJ496_001681 [Pomphorhynchus laevis]
MLRRNYSYDQRRYIIQQPASSEKLLTKGVSMESSTSSDDCSEIVSIIGQVLDPCDFSKSDFNLKRSMRIARSSDCNPEMDPSTAVAATCYPSLHYQPQYTYDTHMFQLPDPCVNHLAETVNLEEPPNSNWEFDELRSAAVEGRVIIIYSLPVTTSADDVINLLSQVGERPSRVLYAGNFHWYVEYCTSQAAVDAQNRIRSGAISFNGNIIQAKFKHIRKNPHS